MKDSFDPLMEGLEPACSSQGLGPQNDDKRPFEG